jgi:hypothetical protein
MTRLESTARKNGRRADYLSRDEDEEEVDREELALEYLSPDRAQVLIQQFLCLTPDYDTFNHEFMK